MKLISKQLKNEEIEKLKNKYGDYLKLTVDLEKGILVAGGKLHADGERILLDKGSNQDQIWGGGISLKAKLIDTTAVLNLRPGLRNDSLEILNPQRREKILSVITKIFKVLWD